MRAGRRPLFRLSRLVRRSGVREAPMTREPVAGAGHHPAPPARRPARGTAGRPHRRAVGRRQRGAGRGRGDRGRGARLHPRGHRGGRRHSGPVAGRVPALPAPVERGAALRGAGAVPAPGRRCRPWQGRGPPRGRRPAPASGGPRGVRGPGRGGRPRSGRRPGGVRRPPPERRARWALGPRWARHGGHGGTATAGWGSRARAGGPAGAASMVIRPGGTPTSTRTPTRWKAISWTCARWSAMPCFSSCRLLPCAGRTAAACAPSAEPTSTSGPANAVPLWIHAGAPLTCCAPAEEDEGAAT